MSLRTLRIFLLLAWAMLWPYVSDAREDSSVKLRTVVLDAGHGGKDPGAVHGRMQEKSINLDVVLMLGNLIKESYPDVKVVYTRSTDEFISLDRRSEIANHNHADLFMSVHVNSCRNSSVNGTETFVMGADKSQSNMEVCKLENSVILLEDDYSTRYQGFNPDDPASYILFSLMQSAYFDQSLLLASMVQDNLRKGPVKADRGIKQAPLYVLWKTTMPSVLVEIGFISSQKDRDILALRDERRIIAQRLFDSFVSFKEQYDSVSSGSSPADADGPGSAPVERDEAPAPAAPKAGEAPASAGGAASGGSVSAAPEEKSASPSGSHNVDTPNGVHLGPNVLIQVMAAKNPVPKDASLYKSLSECIVMKRGSYYKYFFGPYRDYDDASNHIEKIRRRFKGAYITTVDIKEGDL